MIVWTDGWCDPAVHRQSGGACGGSEGSGGAGSSCEPSQGGFVGGVSWAGSVYPLYGLWFVCVSVVACRWHARECVWCVVLDKEDRTLDAVCARGEAWLGVYVECVVTIVRVR